MTFWHALDTVELSDAEIPITPGLETQKYAKILLPSLTIRGQTLDDFKVMVSRFDPAWGIAALIGLDFFRRVRVTVDYGQGVLVCEPRGRNRGHAPPRVRRLPASSNTTSAMPPWRSRWMGNGGSA